MKTTNPTTKPTKTRQAMTRLPVAMYDNLASVAEINRRSISAEIARAIERHLTAEQPDWGYRFRD